VPHDAGTGLYETYIGLPVSSVQRDRHDGSQERAAWKAEVYLLRKLRHLR
jgi:hypothetical protein